MSKMYAGEYGLKQVGQIVKIQGWVSSVRNHGKIAFIELRDRTGILQVVLLDTLSNFEQVISLAKESVIEICGKIVARDDKFINLNISSGHIELMANDVRVISVSKELPFNLSDYSKVGEEVKQKYRYLDLRRKKMTENIILRHQVTNKIRHFLNSHRFIDIETPYLTKSTPEGARDFLVPSRLQKSQFYALPQSPQIMKQLLMGSGFDRYYQIVRCFRDEDLRGDRQPEFTQVDIEMSFSSQKEIQELIEDMLKEIVREIKSETITDKFPEISYSEAIRRFGSDKPDTRFAMELVNLTDELRGLTCPFLEKAYISPTSSIQAIVLPKTDKPLSKKKIEALKKFTSDFGIEGFATAQFDGVKFQTSLKSLENVRELAGKLSVNEGDLVFFLTGEKINVQKALGALRCHLAKEFDLIDDSLLNFIWVTDWPLLEWNADDNRYQAMHHPFTQADIENIVTFKGNPVEIKSKAYDIVLNGYEIGGGSIRNHVRCEQESIFKLLGMEKSRYEKDFGFFLEALDYGFPPHGGLALGLDRLVMILACEDNIRQVIAYPKNGVGRDIMLGAPDNVKIS